MILCVGGGLGEGVRCDTVWEEGKARVCDVILCGRRVR